MSDFEKFKEELPHKEKLYSLLTGKEISDKEYEHVLKAWNKFKMKTMEDYHNLYLKWDVLLLADIFQKFTNNSLKNCGLCQSRWLKPYVEFNTQKRIEGEKYGDKDRKALCKLMNNAVYRKTMQVVRDRIDVKLVSNKNDYLKWASKPNYKPLWLL